MGGNNCLLNAMITYDPPTTQFFINRILHLLIDITFLKIMVNSRDYKCKKKDEHAFDK